MKKGKTSDNNNYLYIDNVFYKSSEDMSELPDNSIDLIITSPPYYNIKDYWKDGTQNKKHSKKQKNDIGNIDDFNKYIEKLLKVWKECHRVVKPNGKLCINVPLMPILKKKMNTHHNRHIYDLQSHIQNSILLNTNFFLYDLYIWNRKNSTKKIMFGSYPYPNNFYNQNIVEFITIFVKDGKKEKISNNIKEASKLTKNEWVEYTKQIWNIAIPNKSDIAFGDHSAIMPEEIPRRLIKMFSFVGDVVLDPFLGSGTTARVAKSLNRNYVGYEIYKNYKETIDNKIKHKKNIKNKINTLISKDVFHALNMIENNSIDLIIADPPYNQKIDYWDEFDDEDKYFEFMQKWILEAIKKLKDTGSIYIFNNNRNNAKIFSFLEDNGLIYRNWITWYKKDGFSSSKNKYLNNQESILFFTKSNKYVFNYDEIRVPYLSKERIDAASKTGIIKNGKRWFPNDKGKLCTDVWEISSERHTRKVNGKTIHLNHPTIKPTELIKRIILASSNKNDLVLDMFSGSGITSKISKSLGRNFIAIEKDKKYSERIRKDLNL